MTSLNLVLLDLAILLMALIHWDFMDSNESTLNNEVICSECDFFTTKSKCIKCNKDICEDCFAGLGSSQMCRSCYFMPEPSFGKSQF